MPSRFSTAFRTGMLSALAGTAAGCVSETHNGDVTVFTFATWVPIVALLVGALILTLGLLIRRKSSWWGFGLIAAGLLAGGIFAPGFLLDKATVSPSGFTLRTGFWFAPTAFDIPFADLSRIELLEEEQTDARGVKSTSRYLLCRRKSGMSEKVPFGDLMDGGMANQILDKARQLGIAVVDKS